MSQQRRKYKPSSGVPGMLNTCHRGAALRALQLEAGHPPLMRQPLPALGARTFTTWPETTPAAGTPAFSR